MSDPSETSSAETAPSSPAADSPASSVEGGPPAPSADALGPSAEPAPRAESASRAEPAAPAEEPRPGLDRSRPVLEPPLRSGATLVAQGVLPRLPRGFVGAAAAVVALVALAIYVVHGCRTVYFFDSAELTIGARRLGIVHPSGYPLYLLLGRLFQSVLSFVEPARAMNLMSAFFAGGTIFFLFLAMMRMTREFGAALVASLTFACSFTFWSLSLVAEVYTLQTFFLALLLWMLLGEGAAAPRPAAVALVLGLGLSAHLSTVFVVPGVLVFLALREGRKLLRPRTLGLCLGAGLLGLSFYAYLPIASHVHGSNELWLRIFDLDLTRPGDLLWFVTGKVFLSEYGNASGVRFSDLSYFVSCLTEDLGIVPAFLGLVGFGWMLVRGERVSWILVPGFFLTAGFYVGFRVVDRYTMFCGAFLVFSMWVAYTLAQFVGKTREVLEGPYVVVLVLVLCCLPLGNYFAFHGSLNLAANRAARDGAEVMLRAMPTGAVVVTDLTVGSLLRYVQEDLGQDRRVEPFYFGLECLARRQALIEEGTKPRDSHQKAFDAVIDEIEALLQHGPVFTTLCNHAVVERFALVPKAVGLFALERKRARIAPPDKRANLVRFGEKLALTEVRCSSWTVKPGDVVRLTYGWRKLGEGKGPFYAVVRLVDERGRPVVFHRSPAGHDHRVGGRPATLDQLEPGWSLEEVYALWFPPRGASTEIGPGRYRLVLQVSEVGFAGPFLEARQDDGGSNPGRTVVVVGTFEVGPSS